jgi:hypothetical protein
VNLDRATDNGIRVIAGFVRFALTTVLISENRLRGLRGDGISLETLIVSAKIERNMLSAIARNGLIMAEGSAVFTLSVLGNELFGVANATPAASGESGGEIAGIHVQNVVVGAVSDNVLSGIGANATTAEVIAGIRVDGCLEMRISDNTIVNLAPAATFRNLAAGVLVLAPLGNVQIADNAIRRNLFATTGGGNWQAIRVQGVTSEGTLDLRLARFTTLSPTQRINIIDSFAAASARNEDANIDGNTLHGYGVLPLVEVFVTNSCRFSDNHCSVEGRTAVDLTAGSIIASANRVECAREALALTLRLGGQENAFTVLGNIVGGQMRVNGSPLGLPWRPLNVGP